MYQIFTSQIAVEATTVLTLMLTVALALVMSKRYLKNKSNALFFWSCGIWFFAFGVLIEVLFSFGIYTEWLIRLYLFVVSLLVESLALGSMQLVKSRMLQKAYTIFILISTLLLSYSLLTTHIGYILTNYVVFGNLPNSVIVTSSIITFPAAIIL